MKEFELVTKFCDFIGSLGFDYKRELRKGSYHNEGYVDVVVKSKINNPNFYIDLIAIEAKMNNFRDAWMQAIGNVHSFRYSYILYPIKPSKKSLDFLRGKNDEMRNFGMTVGLIIRDDDEFKVLIKPRVVYRYEKMIGPPLYNLFYHSFFKTTRNWYENRCGRFFNEKELPNYGFKNFGDDYEWNLMNSSKMKCMFCSSKHVINMIEKGCFWCFDCNRSWNRE